MLVITGGVIGGVFYIKNRQWQATQEQMALGQPPAAVATGKVTAESWQPALSAVGSLVAVNDVLVTNEISGKVAGILFKSGQDVQIGDALLQLDDEVDRAELRGLQAELQLTEVQFNRAAKLVKKRTLSQSDYDEAKARLESAEANVASKQATIDKKTIRAPFSGSLGIREVDLGEYLAAGSAIVPLQSLDPIYVDYTLPERYLSKLSVGQNIELTVQAFPDEVHNGRIKALNPGIDPGTRSVHIRAILDNPNTRLRPGMFAEVRILLPRQGNILTVPQQAITYAPYGNSVFVVVEKDGGKVVLRRQVETGEIRDGRIAITSGLERGDEVVVSGQNKLRNDQPIQVNNSVDLNRDDVVISP